MATTRWGTDVGADVVVPWVGNSVLAGARYIGAGGADDDVVLAWNELPTLLATRRHYHMNEGVGAPQDAGSDGQHISWMTAEGWNTTSPWLGAANINLAGGKRAQAHGLTCASNEAVTIETWARRVETAAVDRAIFAQWDWGNKVGWGLILPSNGAVSFWGDRLMSPSITSVANAWPVDDTTWHHIALVATLTTAHIYRDGTAIASDNVTRGALFPLDGGLFVGRWFNSNTRLFSGEIDEVRATNEVRYTADFTPTRYPASGSVVAVTPLTLPRTVNAVSWAATTGADIGAVYRVHVNTGTDIAPDWTQVGGDNPTSPITSIGLATSAADLVRVTLTPRDDTLKSETPTLDWLELDWAAVVTGGIHILRPPLHRLGPSLKGVR